MFRGIEDCSCDWKKLSGMVLLGTGFGNIAAAWMADNVIRRQI
jgi:hypothetical protein